MITGLLFKALLIYLAVLAFLYFYQRNMMYFPDTSRPDPKEFGVVDYVPASVRTEDGLRLESWYFSPKEENGLVLVMFHGNGGHFAHRTFKLPPYVQAGHGVLLTEYRGYGGHLSKPTEQGLYKDARAYMNWLIEEQGVKPSQIVLHGESLGSGIAIQMATEYDVGGVVLEAAFDSTANVAQKTYFFVPVRLLMKDQYRSYEKIGQVNAPILFIHGDQDSIIPLSFGKALYAAANQPKTFITIPGAGHNDLYAHDTPLHVLEFLSNISKAQGDKNSPQDTKE